MGRIGRFKLEKTFDNGIQICLKTLSILIYIVCIDIGGVFLLL